MGLKRIFGKKSKTKKRLSPTTADGVQAVNPSYQYAMKEFAQTVAPASSNDDGKLRRTYQQQNTSDEEEQSQSNSIHDNRNLQATESSDTMATPVGSVHSEYMMFSHATPSTNTRRTQPQNTPKSYSHEPTIVDATYAEHYGDAYVGAPIRYVYPSGYQSMRPRGGPWKLSILICVLFTWLSMFIIGHCSDQYGEVQYDIDDDALAIETRWCGSRLLYLMWVISMSITGMAAAYCGVIGYIKARDFAVANGRSQPPGMVGKSDYYVKLGENGPANDGSYQKTIYQSDGTPQFWGGHIYRPTQAAVAVTSR